MVSIAVIDGPYDNLALSKVLDKEPVHLWSGSCDIGHSSACDHGTFIIGLLGARRDASIPGLCPACQLIHVPLFANEQSPTARVEELAYAISAATTAGAKLVNLSLAIVGDDSEYNEDLIAALDFAQRSGSVVVVAAGNQRRLVTGKLMSHPVTIPVVATDATQNQLADSNFGPAITRRGLAAIGHNIVGYASGGNTKVMSGSSVATAIVTGTLADLWSTYPDADGRQILGAIARLGPRTGLLPPLLNREAFGAALRAEMTCDAPKYFRTERCAILQGGDTVNNERLPSTVLQRGEPPSALTGIVRPAHDDGSTSDHVCTCNANQSRRSGFVYAIGTIEAEYPSVAIEREMQVMGQAMGIEVEADSATPMRITEDRKWQHSVLSKDRKATRYLARQFSWRLSIENCPAFVLKPKDPNDFDQLIDCLARPKYPKRDSVSGKKGAKASATRLDAAQDLDVIVGVEGAQTPDGMTVFLDQIFTIKPEQLRPPGLGPYFEQLADNFGITDEERAYNFLVARYNFSSAGLSDIVKQWELAAVPTLQSRLSSGNRSIVRVIYRFKNRSSNMPQESNYFIRVDVTDEFPFIVTAWHGYLERGEER